MARVQCCAPFCRKAWKGEADVEQLCPNHYMRVDARLRQEYEAAWETADRADRHGIEDEPAFIEVTRAWEAVKADAAAKALAN